MRRTNAIVLGGLCLCTVLFVGEGAVGQPPSGGGAAQAAGCNPPSHPAASATGAWADGSKDALKIVASVSGKSFHDTLGDLCVRLVAEDGHTVAALTPDLRLPPPDVEPASAVTVAIGPTPFQYRTWDKAFAVAVTGGVETQSVGYSWTNLYLFRREGAKLIEIFDDEVARRDEDKVGLKVVEGRAELKVSTVKHAGVFDLIVIPNQGGAAKTYVWDGARYALQKTPPTFR
jgi:hypothetical protein